MITGIIQQQLSQQCHAGRILQPAFENCMTWLNPDLFDSWIIESIIELVGGAHWGEINDRFYQTLAFGTGGLRGRTIGRVITSAERGSRGKDECPEHPAVGSNCMNDFNVRRATMGLVQYVQTLKKPGFKPHVLFAHDPRHFSRHFAELAARTVIECGGAASLFESERSTPELSFAVRHLGADAGVVITASHNPPHDNGFKAYFDDGAQVVEPHASKMIAQVQSIEFETVCRQEPVSEQPHAIGGAIDEAYSSRVESLLLEPEIVKNFGARVKVVYSALHGTGVKMVPSLLKKAGFQLLEVPSQMKLDGQFPTVKSPNPENSEALRLSIELAEKEGAELVLATDPDADRMGVAVRNRAGKMELLSGNQIGSLLAHYRLERLFAQGVLHKANRSRARLIKTVVTTDLQKAIGGKFCVEIPETLTGFKYIGAKLRKYEDELLAATGTSPSDYRKLQEAEKRTLHLQHAHYYVFGGEESYGYSASDFTRDKDANAACLMFAELAAFTRSKNETILDYLDGIYSELGYYLEKLGQLVYEGAEGALKIRRILQSYEKNPPTVMMGAKVLRLINYAREDVRDLEGDLLPKELLFFIELDNGSRYAVRGSGTEPKIKFYMFAHKAPKKGTLFTAPELAAARAEITKYLQDLWVAIEADAQTRSGESN